MLKTTALAGPPRSGNWQQAGMHQLEELTPRFTCSALSDLSSCWRGPTSAGGRLEGSLAAAVLRLGVAGGTGRGPESHQPRSDSPPGESAKVTTRQRRSFEAPSLFCWRDQQPARADRLGRTELARTAAGWFWGSWICAPGWPPARRWHQNHGAVGPGHRPCVSARPAVETLQGIAGELNRRADRPLIRAFVAGLKTGDRAPIHSANARRGWPLGNPATLRLLALEQEQGHTPGCRDPNPALPVARRPAPAGISQALAPWQHRLSLRGSRPDPKSAGRATLAFAAQQGWRGKRSPWTSPGPSQHAAAHKPGASNSITSPLPEEPAWRFTPPPRSVSR